MLFVDTRDVHTKIIGSQSVSWLFENVDIP